jgi:hypothetical protein
MMTRIRSFQGMALLFWTVLFTVALGVCSAWARYYPLPDTGQITCYDNVLALGSCPSSGQAFYGQDGSYLINPPDYAAASPLVTDTLTGLVWQQSDDGVSRYAVEAVSYCDDLTWGGYSDWRLPSRMELLTLVDASRAAPAINPAFAASNGKYWSSTVQAGDTSLGWSVRFSDGLASFDGLSNPYRARCVRGPALTQGAFEDKGETVLDQSTGLVWQKGQSASEMTWQQALAYCEAAETGGKTDWRLPNKRELDSLVDDARSGPALSPLFDVPGASSMFWSSTTVVGGTFYAAAWGTVLYTGVSDNATDKTWSGRARCVRGASPAAPSLAAQDLLLLGNQ